MSIDHEAAVNTMLQDARELFKDERYDETLAVLAAALVYAEKRLPTPDTVSAYRTLIYRYLAEAAYALGRVKDAVILYKMALNGIARYTPQLRTFIVTTLRMLLSSSTAAEDWDTAEEALAKLRHLPPEVACEGADVSEVTLPGSRLH
jgi:tetratricopeptide (TPR) repeat protein